MNKEEARSRLLDIFYDLSHASHCSDPEPKWEDEANKRGGKWLFMVSSKERKKRLEKLWLWTVLACIGESFNCNDDEICGCVVSIRKSQDKIALWTRDTSREITEDIG